MIHQIAMDNSLSNKRIWELDAFRGIAIICVVIIHWFAIKEAVCAADYNWNSFLWFVKQYGGVLFVILSGICVRFSHSCVKRGAVVFAFGMLLTAATEYLYLSGREDAHVLIQFGVLHLLGISMMLYPLYKKLNPFVMLGIAAVIIALGYYWQDYERVNVGFLFPLGLKPYPFFAFDYYPLIPNFGWFMAGTALGELLYKERKTRLPMINPENVIIRALSFCGQHSLWIFLIHQPLFYFLIKGL